MELQPARASDLPQLLEMMREFYAHERIAFDRESSHEALSALLQDDALGEAFIIRDSVAIGYVVLVFFFSLEFRGLVAFIDELYIAEAHRGRGIGSAVLAELEFRCRARGLRALRLEVDHQNDRAKRLYERFGFIGETRSIMTRRL